MILYDHLLYQNKPDLSSVLNTKFIGINAPALYSGGVTQAMPTQAKVQQVAQSIDPVLYPLVMLDVEHWPMPANVQNLVTIGQWFKAALPSGVKFGFYSMAPIRDYWRSLNPASQDFKNWQADNTKMQPLANVVDVLFPSLYTFYPDRAGWVKYATANVNEAKRIAGGKPVIPYLWPHYHESNAAMQGAALLGSYWRLQLDQVQSLGLTSAVIWGGYQKPWNENACWWTDTKDFL